MPSAFIPAASGPAPTSSSTRLRASSVPRNDITHRQHYEQSAPPILNYDDSQRRPVLRKSQKRAELTPAEQYKLQILQRDESSLDRPVPPPKPSPALVQSASNVERIGRPRQSKRPEILQPSTFTDPNVNPPPARLRRETTVHAPEQQRRSRRPSTSQGISSGDYQAGAPVMQSLGYNQTFDSSFQQGASVLRHRSLAAHPQTTPLVHRRVMTAPNAQVFPAMGQDVSRGRSGHHSQHSIPFVTSQESPTSSYTSTSAGTSHYATSQNHPPPTTARSHKRQSSLTRSILSFTTRPRANSDSQGVRPSVVDLPALTPTTTTTRSHGVPRIVLADVKPKTRDSDSTSSVFSRVRKLSTGSLRTVFPCLVPDTVEDPRYPEPTPGMVELHHRLAQKILPTPPGSATSHETLAVKRDRRLSPGNRLDEDWRRKWEIDLPPRKEFRFSRPMPGF